MKTQLISALIYEQNFTSEELIMMADFYYFKIFVMDWLPFFLKQVQSNLTSPPLGERRMNIGSASWTSCLRVSYILNNSIEHVEFDKDVCFWTAS